MALFLSGVLTGSTATQQRHLRQARIMQAAIQQRWQRSNPWTWQRKHVRWFFAQHLKDHSDATRYYYRLTALLIWKRLGHDLERLIQRSNRGYSLAITLLEKRRSNGKKSFISTGHDRHQSAKSGFPLAANSGPNWKSCAPEGGLYTEHLAINNFDLARKVRRESRQY